MAERKRQPKVVQLKQSAVRTGFPIVGIGASAGGFEAFKEILENLPAAPGLALVLVQHLDPSHDSQLTELLARVGPLPVSTIKHGMPVVPDHLYVIPPNTSLKISKGRLRLTPRRTDHTQVLPIDLFLQSLAADCGRRAIGVILSGNASDGVRGLKAIKAAGGITLAQDPQTAKYDGMPLAAVAGGCVDCVLAPAKLAGELLRITRQPNWKPVPVAQVPVTEADGLTAVFRILEKATGVDFSYYKPPTVRRRLAHRLGVCKCATLAEYVAQLKKQPDEVLALYEDILINVTSFFRDPPVFEALRKTVFPKLVAHRSAGQPLRIWVPGCSTGEEVYSLAISLVEFLATKQLTVPLQIFGSDISENNLRKARTGRYPATIAATVSATRLRRFFSKANGGYEINKSIREMCVFAKQNLVKDPPFSRLDLISCRNVLIYLGPVLQAKALPVFHYALKPDGYLLLGTSETIHGFLDLFTVVNRKQRIFAKNPGASRLTLDIASPGTGPAPVALAPAHGAPEWVGTQVQKEADRLLVTRYTPASVLVTETLEIIQFRGHTGPYLEPASGRASLNLLKMAREDLVVDLRNAIQQAKRRNATVRKEGIHLTGAGHPAAVTIEVVPVKTPEIRPRHFLVIFEAAEPVRVRPPGRPPVATDARVAELDDELRTTKEYLQSVITESEGANEELKAANEEIRSANEELQCTNEELETAKEELQSTNEELTTVNDELQSRNQELGQLNNDITNLLTSTQIPVVMLDAELRIRRFTPMAEKILNLIPADVGRPITNFKLAVAVPDLDQLIAAAIETLSVKECEVQDRQGRWYVLRIRPYRTSDNKIDGAVLALLDIDELKRSLTIAREARDFAEAIIETVSEPLLVLTADLSVEIANRAFYETFHGTKLTTVGRRIDEFGDRQWDIPRLRKRLEEVLSKHAEFNDFSVTHKFAGLGQRTLLLSARRLVRADRTTPLIVLAIANVTAHKQAALAEFSDDAILGLDLAGQITAWNKGAQQLYGHAADAVIGQPVALLSPPDQADELMRLLQQLRPGQPGREYETVHVRNDGQRRDVAVVLSPVLTAAGQISGVSAVVHDITARRAAEAQIKAALAEKEVLLREIHHRVKNNLQIIVSLINLQVDNLTDDRLGLIFGDVRNRIFAMALVHEQLYKTNDLARLNFSEYADGLLRHLWQVSSPPAQVQLELAVAPVLMPVDVAVHCGLILNELVSNTIKYAFPGGRAGKLQVGLAAAPAAGLTLRVCDNGVGLPAGMDWRTTKSLGLHLVQLLAGQMQGTVELGPGPGTEFRVTFPNPGVLA